jgi:ketosteroid isomerase-like protein
MSDEAMAVIQRFNDELMQRGQIPWDLLDPELVLIDHDLPDAEDYRGHAGIAKWIEDWSAAWESTTIEPESLVDGGDVILTTLVVTARGKESGIETKRRNATVSKVENGRITRVEYFTSEDEARAAASLVEAQDA